jgi:hypothetical protein
MLFAFIEMELYLWRNFDYGGLLSGVTRFEV